MKNCLEVERFQKLLGIISQGISEESSYCTVVRESTDSENGACRGCPPGGAVLT